MKTASKINARPAPRAKRAAEGNLSSATAAPRAPRVVATWDRIPQPGGAVLLRPGKIVVESGDDEIDSAQAADIIGVSQRRVQTMCDEGILKEGTEWRRPGAAGRYKIKRAAAHRVANKSMPGEETKS